MTPLVPIMMFGWIPVVFLMFWMLPPRRALLAAFILAWLFLPLADFKIPMIPSYTKMTAATLGSLIGLLIFDSRRLFDFRPSWIDLPVAVWCVARFGASMTNGYGAYDGFSQVEYTILTWGLPWLFGRLYFTDAQGMKELAIAFVLGGLIYVPLCLYEARFSPQLARWVYGIQIDFAEVKRFGGWRPTVFMQHGLMTGMWMCMTGMMAWWLWSAGKVRTILRMSMFWIMLGIVVTAILCKSFGAIALLIMGTGALWLASKLKRTWPLLLVLAIPPAYITLRISGMWSGENLIYLAGELGSSDRAGSLSSRINSEDQFIQAGWHKPIFGFRGWYNTVGLQSDETKRGIPDALWMIEFTGSGLVGLACLVTYLLLPPFLVWWRFARRDWGPTQVPVLGLAMIVCLSMVDNLFNAMLNPVFMLTAGALGGWALLYSRQQRVARPSPAQVRRGRQVGALRQA
jgi:hypothetical protein